MNIFGRIVHPGLIDDALRASLQKWLPTYAAEVCGQSSLPRDFLTVPGDDDYITAVEMSANREDPVPCVYIETSRTNDAPDMENGSFASWWRFTITVVVQGQDEGGALRNAQLAVAAVRTLLIQKEDLDGFSDGINWLSEGAAPALDETGRSRQLAAGIFEGAVKISDIATRYAGPMGPDPKPDPTEAYPDWPTVQTTQIEIDKDELE